MSTVPFPTCIFSPTLVAVVMFPEKTATKSVYDCDIDEKVIEVALVLRVFVANDEYVAPAAIVYPLIPYNAKVVFGAK